MACSQKMLSLLYDEEFIDSWSDGSDLDYEFRFIIKFDKSKYPIIDTTNLDLSSAKKSRLVVIKEYVGNTHYISMTIYSHNKKHSIMIYKNGNDISYKGSLLKIGMLKNEYYKYVDFFVRNYNLIYFIRFTNGMHNDKFYDWLRRDEYLRSENYIVIRDKFTGEYSVCDSNNNYINF